MDLFFVLSGFVLMHVYGKRSMTPWGFTVVRLIRLYPIYAFGLLIGLIVNLGGHGAGVSFIMGAFFIPQQHELLYPLNGVSWSLVDEIVVNVIFGFMLARRIGISWLLVASLSVSAALLIFQPLQLRDINAGWTASTWIIGFLRATFSFSLGVILYRYAKKLPSVNGWWIIVGILIVFGIPDATHRAILPVLAIPLLLPLSVLLGTSARATGMSARIFEWLGGISYALYAVHFPILYFVVRFCGTNKGPIVAGALTSVGVAHVLAKYADPPARRWLARFIKPRIISAPTPG